MSIEYRSKFVSPTEVASELGVSKSCAYKIIRQLNDELKDHGFMIISGKVSRAFYEEKFYGMKEVDNVGLQG